MTVITRPAARTTSRRQLLTYALVVAGLVIPANLFAGAIGANAQQVGAAPIGAQIALYAQAVIPAVAALLAWSVFRQRLSWGFRRTRWKVLVSAWFIGVLAVGLGYGVAWLTGTASFSAGSLSSANGGLPPALAALIGLGPGILPWLALAIGEELGWNSFLAVKLAERHGTDTTALIVGVAWALFHLPLMLFVAGSVAPGVPTWWAVVMFIGQCVALAFPLVWIRLRTRSIWPALVLHGTLNSVLYLVAEPATVGSASSRWMLGEGGLLTTCGIILAVLVTMPLWRRRPAGPSGGLTASSQATGRPWRTILRAG